MGESENAAALLLDGALRRGILGGDRAAIVSRLESLADGVLPAGGGALSAAFAGGFPGRGAEEPASLRAVGDAFWRGRAAGREERREDGSFYTPDAVIDRILGLVWKEMFPAGRPAAAPAVTVCDPALGCGFFFLRLVGTLRERKVPPAKIRRWAAASLFGADTDAQAVFVAKALLWLALSDRRTEFIPDPAHFVVGDSLLGRVFGDGVFDVVIGNPPYEVLTNFGRRPERRKLAEALRRCGLYRDSLSGQINLYRCFIERGLDLLKPGGVLSFVTPLSLARDGAAAALRGRLLEREKAEEWILYGEKERLFTGVTQSACVFKARRGGGAAKGVSIVAGGGGRRGRIPFAELREHGGGLALPGLTAAGLKLWRWFHRNCPGRLGDVAEARVGEVDQTFHRACMTDAAAETGAVLVRGAHLAPFRLDTEARPEKERFLDLPRFLAMKGASAAATRDRAGERRIVQLGIRNMQSRPRLVAAIAPPGVYAGNSLNVYRALPGADLHFIAGVLNSVWLDWLFRASSGNNNINLREMLALPFPSRAGAAQTAKVAARYLDCVRAADGAPAPATARAALDRAVGECCGVPEWARAGELEELLL